MIPRYEIRRTGAGTFAVIDTRDCDRIVESFRSVDIAVSFRDAMNNGHVCFIDPGVSS